MLFVRAVCFLDQFLLFAQRKRTSRLSSTSLDSTPSISSTLLLSGSVNPTLSNMATDTTANRSDRRSASQFNHNFLLTNVIIASSTLRHSLMSRSSSADSSSFATRRFSRASLSASTEPSLVNFQYVINFHLVLHLGISNHHHRSPQATRSTSATTMTPKPFAP